jgi:tRNA(Ile2) C34 agmatinyltransferase TiaS
MTLYISIDDTDTISSRGTGRLARSIAGSLSESGYTVSVSRHQLYVHPDIPYTSHNSCAVIHLDSDECERDALFSTARNMILDDFIEGSDPGIACATDRQITAEVVDFGFSAKKTVLTQDRARSVAKEAGLLLEGLGGTHDGIIGALAGLGLAAPGCDGRYVMKGRLRQISGETTVETALSAGVDEVITKDGRSLKTGTIIIRKFPKPSRVNNTAILYVEEKDGIYYENVRD